MRESLFVFFAFALLATINLTIHAKAINSMESRFKYEARLLALTFSAELMDEITRLSFDEKTVKEAVQSPEDLTSWYAFGHDGGDDFKDDVDDYHGYAVAGDSTVYPGFVIGVWVSYLDKDDPYHESKVPSFHKRIEITVENTQGYMEHPFSISSVVSYY